MSRGRAEPGDTLEVPCWCEATMVFVPVALVRACLTDSCGYWDCTAMSGRVGGRGALGPMKPKVRRESERRRPKPTVRLHPKPVRALPQPGPARAKKARRRRIVERPPCVLCGSTTAPRRAMSPVGMLCDDAAGCRARRRAAAARAAVTGR